MSVPHTAEANYRFSFLKSNCSNSSFLVSQSISRQNKAFPLILQCIFLRNSLWGMCVCAGMCVGMIGHSREKGDFVKGIFSNVNKLHLIVPLFFFQIAIYHFIKPNLIGWHDFPLRKSYCSPPNRLCLFKCSTIIPFITNSIRFPDLEVKMDNL